MFKYFKNKIIAKDAAIILVATLFLFGLYLYIDFKVGSLEREIREKELIFSQMNKDSQNKIKDLQNMLLTTATGLANVLEQEQQKNQSLKEEFMNITNTVGTLEKLSTTDPELLKKYSKVYFLNEHYIPISLTTIDKEYLNTKSKNTQIHTDVLPYLERLIDDANKEGLTLEVLSAYRSFATQSSLKASYTFTYGVGTANKFSADQGYSEHQLGTTVDFTTEKTGGILEGFEKTPEYKWLLENAHKYGFVISYPAGNTYYKFEPWHWRFVGVALAERVHDENMYFYDMDQRIIDSYLANIFD